MELNTGKSWGKYFKGCKRLETGPEVHILAGQKPQIQIQPDLQCNGLD